MKPSVTKESLFELAIELRNKGKTKDSIAVLTKILVDHPHDNRIHMIHSVLGGIYSELKQYKPAFTHFQIATKLKPESELASLGLYIACSDLDDDKAAIDELIRYLKNYPADMYKDTLEELLEGLKDGYMSEYEEAIRSLAKKNNRM